mmetsp:Transcript_1769/g.4596  ORF Transcript_1769/g.4596 Transcript_1769/m.4596 type:complete len:209 (-) Transcript_1769:327-953(-)
MHSSWLRPQAASPAPRRVAPCSATSTRRSHCQQSLWVTQGWAGFPPHCVRPRRFARVATSSLALCSSRSPAQRESLAMPTRYASTYGRLAECPSFRWKRHRRCPSRSTGGSRARFLRLTPSLRPSHRRLRTTQRNRWSACLAWRARAPSWRRARALVPRLPSPRRPRRSWRTTCGCSGTRTPRRPNRHLACPSRRQAASPSPLPTVGG